MTAKRCKNQPYQQNDQQLQQNDQLGQYSDFWVQAADYAEQQLMGALLVMVELMNDRQQASTARASVIKTFVDVAVKLHEMRDSDNDGLKVLDKLLAEFKEDIDDDMEVEPV